MTAPFERAAIYYKHDVRYFCTDKKVRKIQVYLRMGPPRPRPRGPPLPLPRTTARPRPRVGARTKEKK